MDIGGPGGQGRPSTVSFAGAVAPNLLLAHILTCILPFFCFHVLAGNALEFKAMTNPSNLFAKYYVSD